MDLRFIRHSVAALLCAVALSSCGFSTTDRVLRKMSEARFILPEGCLSVDGSPVFVGNPLYSNSLWNLFIRAVDSL